MKYLDWTAPTPEENLACDEALLNLCDNKRIPEVLRFWEPSKHFIVLGYACKANQEVYLEKCSALKIPVLRRPSGGGTVLQGPGCLNYSLLLEINRDSRLRNLSLTNEYVLSKNAAALQSLLDQPIEIKGTSDLVIGNLKFSGNAQRRGREWILFHGTFLLSLDLSLLEEILPPPPKQPDYRDKRPHRSFLTQLSLSSEKIKEAMRLVWQADDKLEGPPKEEIEELVAARYSRPEWNFKFK